MAETRSTCPYCGVGCGVVIEHDGARIRGVRGDADHPANFGRLCSKGASLHLTAAPAQLALRALRPELRTRRDAPRAAVGWNEALDTLAARIAQALATRGPDGVGLYISGQLLTEDYYVFNKLAKGLLRTNNVDTNSRLCMSSAVAGYKATLGADAPPCCYDDLALADTLFVAGSNAAYAHPILWRRVEAAKAARPDLRIVVVDPRRSATAELADLHLPLQPGSDVALFHAMLHVMLWDGLIDAGYVEAHTRGFDALRARVRDYAPAAVAGLTGLKPADIERAAHWFAGLDRKPSAGGARAATLSLYCQGLNQSTSGTDKNAALINLHLACGQIGRPGAGPFSLTGQPNAMGGREVGGLANQLAAHRELADDAARAEVAALWGVDALSSKPGLTAVEMFEAAADGALELLWIVCTNPAHSLPDQPVVRRALERCPFVVLQDAYRSTATAPYADLLLPAASWGEKEGTVTNSERRISRVRAAVPPPGQARADWAIARDVALRLERLLPQARAAGRPSLFAHLDTPEAIWCEHRRLTEGRDLDIGGLSYAILERDGPQQWPFPAGAGRGRARLYEDGRFATADGRARFADVAWRPPAEQRDARHPFALTTGRLRDQWHGASRSGSVARLWAHAPEPVVELHADDLARLGAGDGTLLRLRSRRGSIVLPARASAEVAPLQAFVAMHWGAEFVSGHDAEGRPALGVNALLPRARCPQSKQPELKHAALRIERAQLPWRLLWLHWNDEPAAGWARMLALRPLLARFGYASLVPFGHDGRLGLQLRAAAAQAPEPAALEALARELMQAADAQDEGASGGLRYADARHGRWRALRLDAEGRIDMLLLAGDAAEVAAVEALLAPLLRDERTPPVAGVRLLAPPAALAAALRGAAGAGGAARDATASKVLCSCFGVRNDAVDAVLARHCAAGGGAAAGEASGRSAEQRALAALQAELRCGTNCGSCLPELRTRVRTALAAAPQPEALQPAALLAAG